jgi:hypothetical protein
MGITEIITIITLAAGLGTSLIKLNFSLRSQKTTTEKLAVTHNTLVDMITAIDLVPQTDAVKKVKQTIAAVTDFTGNNQALLTDLVDETTALLKQAGMATSHDETSPLDIARAINAVVEARAVRAIAKDPPKLPLFATLILLAVLLCPGLFACAPVPQRLTTEIVIGANPASGAPAEVVIQWPAGVRKADLYSTEISSRTLTTAPLAK